MSKTDPAPPDGGKASGKTTGAEAAVPARRRVPREVWMAAVPAGIGLITVAVVTIGPIGAIVVVLIVAAILVGYWLRRRHRRATDPASAREAGRLRRLVARALPRRLAARIAPAHRPPSTPGSGQAAGGGRGLLGGLLGRGRGSTGGGNAGGGGLLGRVRAARHNNTGGRGRSVFGARAGRTPQGGILGRKTAAASGGSTRGGLLGRKAATSATGGGRPGVGSGRKVFGSAGGGGGRTAGRSGGRTTSGRSGGSTGGRNGTKAASAKQRGTTAARKKGRRLGGMFTFGRDRKNDPSLTLEAANYITEFLDDQGRILSHKPSSHTKNTDPPPIPETTQPPKPRPRYEDPPTEDFTPVTPGTTADTAPQPATPSTTGGDDAVSAPDYMGAVTHVESATDALQVVKKMPDKLNEHAAWVRRQHNAIQESVRLNPEVQDAMGVYATTADLHAQAYDVADVLRTAHAADLERLERGDPRDAAWDITKNKG